MDYIASYLQLCIPGGYDLTRTVRTLQWYTQPKALVVLVLVEESTSQQQPPLSSILDRHKKSFLIVRFSSRDRC